MDENIIGCEFGQSPVQEASVIANKNRIISQNGILPSLGTVIDPNNVEHDAYELKVLYIYTINNDKRYENIVKVGDTTVKGKDYRNAFPHGIKELAFKAAEKRILKDMHNAAGTPLPDYKIEFAEVITGSLDFRDHKIHAILEYNNIKRHKFEDSSAREWFQTTPEVAIDVFEAYKNGYTNLDNFKTEQVRMLRDEQERFVKSTLEAISRGDKKRLWDAKMRFGKTTTAMAVLKESMNTKTPIQSALIATNRPDVLSSWLEEYEVILKPLGWQFSAKDKKFTQFKDIDKSKPYIVFMSLQDLKGADKKSKNEKEAFEFKKSNQNIFAEDQNWDILFIDEAHEGNDTELANMVHSSLTRSFTLFLSGTPFKYLERNDFATEEIDTWDYIQEQQAKESWANIDSESNPYKLLPKLSIHAVELSEELRLKFINEIGSSSFSFTEFFRLNEDEDFIHEKSVQSFIDRLKGENEAASSIVGGEVHMPYSQSFISSTLHTLWVLPSNVKMCEALGRLLKKDEFFKDYEIIIAAGSDTKESKNALQTVKQKINEKPKTITLTVGKLTTGVTVPEWTGVLMMTNMSSASLYMQTIFRAQSPYESEKGIKSNAFVWDFAPDRVLQVISEVAGVSSMSQGGSTKDQQERLNEMLNFMPIISHTRAGDLRKFDAGEITIQINRFYGERAINAGFESPLLFNLNDFTDADTDMIAALENIRESAGKGQSLAPAKLPLSIPIATTMNNPALFNSEEEIEPNPKKELTKEEKEYQLLKKENDDRIKNLKNILYNVSRRIPFVLMALSCDKEFKSKTLNSDFTIPELVRMLDPESFKEFFGTITIDSVDKVSQRFNMDAVRASVVSWVARVDHALTLVDTNPEEYADSVYDFMSKIKNPNKETVFTPAHTVKMVYKTSGFSSPEDWGELYLSGTTAAQKGVTPFPTFHDINTKSGLFPMFAANNLFQNSSGRSWKQVCNESIYANARTLAGKWATCSLLGLEKNWRNITVIDINFWLNSEELDTLKTNKPFYDSEGNQIDFKMVFLSHYLLAPLNAEGNETPPDIIKDVDHRAKIIKIVEEYLEECKIQEKSKITEKELTNAKVKTEAEIKAKLNITKQFDHVISNPPYQLSVSSREGQDDVIVNIFQHFYNASIEIARKVTMIFPGGRWMQRSKGCDSIADSIFKTAETIDWYPNGDEKGITKIFDRVRIPDGIAIVNGAKKPINNGHIKLNGVSVKRPAGKEILPLESGFGSLIAKTSTFSNFLIEKKNSRTLFGILSSFVAKNPTKVVLITASNSNTPPEHMPNPIKAFLGNEVLGKAKSVKEYWIDSSEISWDEKKLKIFSQWKVTGSQGGISKTPESVDYKVIDNKHIVGETYLIVNSFDTQEEAENFQKYLKTDTVKKLLEASKAGKIGQWGRFVPDLMDYSSKNKDIDWSEPLDQQLHKLFGLSKEDKKMME